ncbi:hypothetical protein KO494_06420 [Lacinutrix sp. C3R15]|uniref:hypothetical protein n=1 Tax=Flavobacteriaceae TaxID=49546 RepID=UPI001C086314|nr:MULTISPECIES: hypothetical protein [Flavobacteriaceae]MBU2939169.1 hypothetical protein [Lacinutrix sp. C3R15]MDO6622485.1 hypothetical protein [Oceanihabitans sp. 1_MG-2023]
MENNNLTDFFNFSVDQNVIFCNVVRGFNEKYISKDLEDLFSVSISNLSSGEHLPILVDMENLNFYTSIKVFKFLSNNSKIKSIVLSETFLVNSYCLKVLLSFQNFIRITVIPDAVFKSFKSAFRYCDENNKMYNALS